MHEHFNYKPTSEFGPQPQLDPIRSAERFEESVYMDYYDRVQEFNGYSSKIPLDKLDTVYLKSRYVRERGYQDNGDLRSFFEKDRDKIESSAYFRRLQQISQVDNPNELKSEEPFALQYYHTRLTHTLEVSRIAVRIGKNLRSLQPDVCRYYSCLELDVINACCLAHDLGHPPFGHVCETILAELMAQYGGFEGNAQTIRIICQLDARSDAGFLKISRRTVASCLKYPWTFEESQKLGTSKYSIYSLPDTARVDKDSNSIKPVSPESVLFDWIYEESLRDPSKVKTRLKTPECEIMDFADDIAYATSDFCEALPENQKFQSLKDWNNFHQYFKSDEAKDTLASILAGEWGAVHLDIDNGIPRQQARSGATGSISLEEIFTKSIVNTFHLYTIWNTLFKDLDSSDIGGLKMSTNMDNRIKGVLMSPKLMVPIALKGLDLPKLVLKPTSHIQARDGFRIEQNISLCMPTLSKQIKGQIEVYSCTERGRYVTLCLAILKTLARIELHTKGRQREKQRVGGLKVALLVQEFARRYKQSAEKQRDLMAEAQKILLSPNVDMVRQFVPIRKKLSIEEEIVLMRFCCDLAASLREPQVRHVFKDNCLIADKLSPSVIVDLKVLLSNKKILFELGEASDDESLADTAMQTTVLDRWIDKLVQLH